MDAPLVRISIHTPAKGVTDFRNVASVKDMISIHTPAKGVTFFRCAHHCTPPISIHTPAKGVTDGSPIGERLTRISIHTPAKGVTIAIGTTNNGIAEFIISLPTSMRARPSLNCDFSKIQIANVEANSYSYATNGEVMFVSNAEACIHFSCTTSDGKARLRSDNEKIILDANL